MAKKSFFEAARRGNLPHVQRMLADGEACITDTDANGRTALLCAAMGGRNALPTLKWLLEEGGAQITDRCYDGDTALFLAAFYGRLATCQYLVEHGGADIADKEIIIGQSVLKIIDTNNAGNTIWDMLSGKIRNGNAAEVTALLRVIVLKTDIPANIAARLSPEHAQVVEEGARLKAALPAYLAQRRALLDAHCPLIPPLLALVRGYDPEPTTTEELWATGLGAAPL
jgi:hypothetical protein